VRVGDVKHAAAADGEAAGMAARAWHVDISGRTARLGIEADHPAGPATDAQAFAAICRDVNATAIDRKPLRVVAGVEARQPDAPHDRRRIGCPIELAFPRNDKFKRERDRQFESALLQR
jgi:hypothetical protein